MKLWIFLKDRNFNNWNIIFVDKIFKTKIIKSIHDKIYSKRNMKTSVNRWFSNFLFSHINPSKLENIFLDVIKISWISSWFLETIHSGKKRKTFDPISNFSIARTLLLLLLLPLATNRVISRSVVVFLWPGGQKVRSRVSNEKDT